MKNKKYYGHPKFYKIVEELKDLHSRKNFDYAGTGDPLGNFDRCGQMMKAVLSEGGFEELKVLLVYMSKQFDGVIDMIGKNRTAQVEGIKDKERFGKIIDDYTADAAKIAKNRIRKEARDNETQTTPR